jgi:uncharacterized repeat protein (TIGR02543 family)
MTKKIAIINYHGILNMQAYVAEFTDGKPYENIVGVKADIKVEVLGVPENNYVRVVLNDIDIPDQVDHYNDTGTMGENNYFGLDYPYAESVVINGTPSSDVYVSDGKKYLIYDDAHPHKFASVANGNDSSMENGYTRIEYLAPAGTYGLTWAGSDCGTSIVMDVALPNEAKYLNKITNTSSLYKVRYFYMNDSYTYGDPYRTTELRMVKPSSTVAVTDADKKPELTGYVLDSRTDYTKKYSGTTSKSNDAKNPLTLDVYFSKALRVIYHDNVGDIVWKPAVQTYPDLGYKTPTPDYDTDLETADIQGGDPVREGWIFKGWSEEPDTAIITVPAEVTKNADYWAHWEADDNQYMVAYYYEVNGKYPTEPDEVSAYRFAKTDTPVEVTAEDKIPHRAYYVLSDDMTAGWADKVWANGKLVLKVYFRSVPRPVSPTYVMPVTGVE